MFRYLLFDLDGTILDTNEIILSTFEHTLKLHLNYDVQRTELMQIFGQPLRQQMKYFSPELADEMCRTYRDVYAKRSSALITVFPGVIETLAKLKRQNITMAVVTNKYKEPAELNLREFGLWPYFDLVLGGDEVQHFKPHPEGLLKAMELIQAIPAQTLMIGDSPIDLEAAARAGVQSVLVSWNIFPQDRFELIKPGYHLEKMDDLTRLVGVNVA